MSLPLCGINFLTLSIGYGGEITAFFRLFLLGAGFAVLLFLMRLPSVFIRRRGRFLNVLSDAIFSVTLIFALPYGLEIIVNGRLDWFVLPAVGLGGGTAGVLLHKALDKLRAVAYNIRKKKQQGVRND